LAWLGLAWIAFNFFGEKGIEEESSGE